MSHSVLFFMYLFVLHLFSVCVEFRGQVKDGVCFHRVVSRAQSQVVMLVARALPAELSSALTVAFHDRCQA